MPPSVLEPHREQAQTRTLGGSRVPIGEKRAQAGADTDARGSTPPRTRKLPSRSRSFRDGREAHFPAEKTRSTSTGTAPVRKSAPISREKRSRVGDGSFRTKTEAFRTAAEALAAAGTAARAAPLPPSRRH